jgi:O-antigen ligase
MKKYISFLDKVIEIAFTTVFFLIPLIFLPFTFELFEFNKIMLLWTLAVFIISAWAVKSILLKKIIFKRTFWDIPLAIFLFSQLVSLIFSIDPYTSFWGYYSRFNGGFLSLAVYALCYWAFVSNLSKKQTGNVLSLGLLSAAIVSVYGIFEHFGRSFSCLAVTGQLDTNCWVQDVQARVFATLGQPNWLAAFLVGLIPFSWLGITKKKVKTKITFIILFCLFYITLLFTGSRSGFLGLVLSFALFWPLLLISNLKKNFKTKFLLPFVSVLIPLVLITFFFGTPISSLPTLSGSTAEENINHDQPQTTTLVGSQGGTESGEIRKIVWRGAIDLWKKYPVLGTGPETFAYSYYWTRPQQHNLTSEWDFLYNKAHNEFLNYAATSGSFGLAAYLGLIASFAFFCFKNIKRSTVFIAGLSAFGAINLAHFFGFSVVVSNLFFFLIPALVLNLTKREKTKLEKTARKLTTIQVFLLGLIAAFCFYCLSGLVYFWQADILFTTSNKLHNQGDYPQAKETLEQAISFRKEPVYLDALSQILAGLSLSIIEQDEPQARQLASQAIALSDQAITLSPFHLNFWKNRIKILYSFAKLDPQLTQNTIDALKQAAKLAPTDPKISYNLGLIYLQTKQFESAVTTLTETVQLKPDYILARYALSLALEEEGKTTEAKRELEFIIENIDPNFQPALEKLK